MTRILKTQNMKVKMAGLPIETVMPVKTWVFPDFPDLK